MKEPPTALRARALVAILLVCAIALGSLAAETPSTAPPTAELATQVRDEWAEIESLLTLYTEASGDERLVLDAQIDRLADRIIEHLSELADRVASDKREGLPVEAEVSIAAEVLGSARRLILADIDVLRSSVEMAHRQRNEVSPAELLGLERKIAQAQSELSLDLDALREVARLKELFRLDAGEDWSDLETRLASDSLVLASEIEVTAERIADVENRLASAGSSESSDLKTELRALRERLRGATAALQRNVELMELRGVEAAEFKQLLIRATGNVTTDILDRDVAVGLLRRAWRGTIEWIQARAPQLAFNLLLFLLIVAAFRLLSRFVRQILTRALAQSQMPELLKSMSIAVGANTVFLVGLLVGLGQLGFKLGPLLAGLGVVGFIVGFALQNTLSNFASGLMILIYRPFDVGDVVEAGGVSGSVSAMSLVSTTILTFDNERMIVPNDRIWGNVIRNRSAEGIRRVDMTFAVGDDQPAAEVEQVLSEIVAAQEGVLAEPVPTIKVHAIRESVVDFIVRPWVSTPDYWNVYWDVTRAVKQRLDDRVLSPPHPKQQVSLSGDDRSG